MTIVAIVGVSVVLVACSDAEPEPEPSPSALEPAAPTLTPTVSASPTATEALACPNQAVAADPARRSGGRYRMDVDGDRFPEDVFIASDPVGTLGCQAFIVVEIQDVFYSEPIWENGADGGLPAPSIHGFADIDGDGGVEILVDEAGGASTQFVGAFVFRAGDLSRVTVPGGISSSPELEGLFAYGGSVGHLEAVDCAPDGTIVVSSAVPGSSQEDLENGIYSVERTFYLLRGAELRKQGATREQVPAESLNEFPEYSAGPFGSC